MADSNKATKRGSPSRQGEYAKVAAHEEKILQTLLDLLDHKNENVRLGAAKTLYAKILPDRKAVEVTGEDGQPIRISVIGGGFVPQSQFVNAASTASDFSSTTIQSISMASESQEDDNSNSGDDPSSS